MCGIFGIYDHEEAARLAYLGLYALQHRGEESAGIVASDGKKAFYHRGMGLVGDVFNEKILEILKGHIAIGHNRYSTTGSSTIKNAQPFFAEFKKGPLALAHNGNLTNADGLREELENTGAIFQSTMDSEVIVHLLARGGNMSIEDNLTSTLSRLVGSYSLVIMMNGTLVGARDPRGWRPLCLGKMGDSYILASETCALDLLQAEYVRDIEPGEIVLINKDGLRSLKPFAPQKINHCIFEYIYFARPDSRVFGHSVDQARKELGRQLAREYPTCRSHADRHSRESGNPGNDASITASAGMTAKADFVMAIPDSGNCAALGYAAQSGLPYEIGMIRNHYIGRTFIQPSQATRDFKVKVKLNPIKEMLNGKRIVVVEDSIVRGTTSKSRIDTLRAAGAKEIHMMISCPPLTHPCFFGIDFPTKKELIASSKSIEEIRKFIGVDSLNYLSLEGMLKCSPIPPANFCHACFDGAYPIPVSLADQIA